MHLKTTRGVSVLEGNSSSISKTFADDIVVNAEDEEAEDRETKWLISFHQNVSVRMNILGFGREKTTRSILPIKGQHWSMLMSICRYIGSE